MPFNLPVAKKGAGAPNIKDGLALLRFEDLRLREHPDWAGTDQFGNEDDGQRFHFMFAFSADGKTKEVVYNEDGDPEIVEATTRTATGKKSNFRAILSGILTPAELAAWDAQTEEKPADFSAVPGRWLHAKIVHNKSDWPQVDSIVGIAD